MTLKTKLLAATAATLIAGAAHADDHATDNPMVGGAAMMADMTIVENAANAPNLSTLVAALQQAELVETLSSEGPFTVFAPTDDAFAAIPDDTLSALMVDENRAALQGILTYHVVAGDITAEDLVTAIETHEFANFETVAGGTITAEMAGDDIRIFDETGAFATVTTADVMQSNGVVHVIDTVLMPES